MPHNNKIKSYIKDTPVAKGEGYKVRYIVTRFLPN